jgi:hypothetical protein
MQKRVNSETVDRRYKGIRSKNPPKMWKSQIRVMEVKKTLDVERSSNTGIT